MAVLCLSTMIIRQRSFSPYCASKAFFRSSGSDLNSSRRQFPQGEGRIDDVAGVLDRADSPLLIERPQPALTRDSEPAGDRLDLLIDLRRGDRPSSCRCRAWSISVRLMSSSRTFLPFAGEAFVGKLLTRDGLVVDDRDRVAGIHRNPAPASVRAR